MVHELKKSISEGVVSFGMRQALKNSSKLTRVVVPSDCREDIIATLKNNNIEIELMEFSKHELAQKLELDFQCEVFGVTK